MLVNKRSWVRSQRPPIFFPFVCFPQITCCSSMSDLPGDSRISHQIHTQARSDVHGNAAHGVPSEEFRTRSQRLLFIFYYFVFFLLFVLVYLMFVYFYFVLIKLN